MGMTDRSVNGGLRPIADVVTESKLAHSPAMRVTPIILLLVGAVLFVWPHVVSRPITRKRVERLERLRAGAEENYLDERRELETYRWVGGVLMWRVVGALVILMGMFSLLPPFVPPQGP